ncbi:MAG: AmmeMemoRadiSam system radical SAM enzyme [bacterium]|nr:AmmeMemoRadiSam system radical SAM enzyme [bacterium]
MEEAKFYKKEPDQKVRCYLCSHRCLIPPDKLGICGVRRNIDGTLYSLVYGKAIADQVDPIEKKPFFHFYPGSLSFSIATVGCNFRCLNCQNFSISQIINEGGQIIGKGLKPEQIVESALLNRCESIAYTYTEPTIFLEYVLDTAKIAKPKGIKNVLVTNGYITEEALREAAPLIDAANIDLKGFNEERHLRLCGAKLKPVLDSIRLYHDLGIWIEVTTLVIPHHNDSPEELDQIAHFLADLDPAIPWHVTRFSPAYKLIDEPRTPIETLQKAREIGLAAGLRYVYTGNIPGEMGENTFCYQCHTLLIERRGFFLKQNIIKEAHCPNCGAKIDGVGLG